MIRLSPLELLDRLAARPTCGGCPPPPRVHRHRYHGVLAPDSPLRSAVTASGGCPTDPFSIRDVLSHLGEPVRPPTVHPARGPPAIELDFAEPSADGMDPTPAIDPAEPEPIPPYEMDRTRSW